MPRFILIFFLFLLNSVQAALVKADYTTVELIAEQNAIVPGESFDIAVRFKLDPHWHIYWENPGASGLPTAVEWSLPEGVIAGEIQWPSPERISLGGLINYGFEHEAVFVFTMQASEALEIGTTVKIEADASWLICKEACLPGDAFLELSLLVAATSELSNEAAAFEAARTVQPKETSPWLVSAYRDSDALVLVIEGDAVPADLYAYLSDEGLVDPSAEQTLSFPSANRAELRLTLDAAFADQSPGMISGVLQSSENSWQLLANVGAKPLVIRDAAASEPVGFEQRLLALGLPGLLALAFLGGLILNIMPCVLPVLSLKVFSLLKHAGQTRGEALRHGLAYALGVVASFLVLAGVLFALRAAGERLGWGFQLQSPGFVVVLATIFFLFGLNLMGLFEVGSRLIGADASLAKRNDILGSFGMGVLAAVVGAPCMGPLVAGVSGLAVQANISTGLLIFGMMGFGLASPFLILSIFPKLVGFLPKPGIWMESFKQGMGFLLFAAVIFLALVSGRQGGVDAVIILLMVVLFSSIGAWIFGRWASPSRSVRSQRIAKLMAFGVIVLTVAYGIRSTRIAYEQFTEAPTSESTSGQWAAWSQDSVDALLAEGRPVFVDFTATWCLICQVNKKVALRTDATEALFEEYGVVALSADWTRYDSEITDALESFGRSGVPLYVLYSPDGEVTVLPQSLTNGLVREAVEAALK